MESAPVLETRKPIRTVTIDEIPSKRTVPEPSDQPRFERRHYKRYHICQRWVRHSFHR